MAKKRSALESQVSWVSFDPAELEAARRVLESLGSNITVDVLGLGNVMENVSDVLFPATSTLHTRARYLLFVPSILANLYRYPRSSHPERDLFQSEFAIQRALVAGGEKEGVIGRTRADALKYWPSLTYWNAVNRLKILGPKPLSREQIYKAIVERIEARAQRNESEESNSQAPSLKLPEDLFFISRSIYTDAVKGKLRPELSFELTKPEAMLLKAKYELEFGESLLTHLLKQPKKYVETLESPFQARPQMIQLRERVKQAELYALFSVGAYTGYRWALCDFRATRLKSNTWADYRERNLAHFTHWHKRFSRRATSWSVSGLFESYGLPIDKKLAEFQTSFNKKAAIDSPVRALRALAGLLRLREFSQKRNRSHFEDLTVTVPENIKGEQPVSPYDYRFATGQSYVVDILEGLRK